jgi:multidrug efflux pump
VAAAIGELAGLGAKSQAVLQPWLVRAVGFTPGLLAGLVLGWFVARPVNAVLRFLFRGFNYLFDRMTAAYGWTVGKSLRLTAVVLAIYGGLLALTYGMIQQAPTGFVPQQDQGRIFVGVQLPDSASLQRTQETMRQIEEITRHTRGVADTISICGMSFVQQATGSNFGSLFVVLDPFAKRRSRQLSDEAIMASLRRQWGQQVKEARVIAFGAPPIPGLSVAGGFKVMVQDKGSLGPGALQEQSDRFIRRLKKEPDVVGVSTQFRSSTPQLYMDIDREKLASLGVSFDEAFQSLQVFLGSPYVNSFNEFGRHWQVTVQADGAYRARPETLNLFRVRNNRGQMVPLGTLVSVRDINGPAFVTRYNLAASAPITGSLRPGASSGEFIAATDALAQATLPRSMRTEWTELMFMQIKEGSTAGYAFTLAVMSVFLVLAAFYESWTLPLAVILVVPMCVLCSIAGVLATSNTVNVFVQIGLVVLVGLACKNAILVVEFARHLHEQGRPAYEATLEASCLRLRPILMTSFAFVLGTLPLVIASGAGAEMRRSLGTAVFSGMLGVTFFGIFLTPVFFHAIQGFGETRWLSSAAARWTVSTVLGGLLGAASGWLVSRPGAFNLFWGVAMGACGGVLASLAVLGIHRRIRPQDADNRPPEGKPP